MPRTQTRRGRTEGRREETLDKMTTRALTSAIFAATCCLGTSKAFVPVPGIENINGNKWREVDTCNKAPIGSSSSRGRFAAESIVHLPRVPSAKDHAETARASSCPLRLHDVFEELPGVSLW